MKTSNNKLDPVLLDNQKNEIKYIISKIIDLYYERALSNNTNKTMIEEIKIDDFSKTGLKSIKQLLDLLENNIFDKAIYKSKQKYLKFIDNGVSSVNIIASTTNSLLNQNLTAHMTDSPGATINEISLINHIRKKVGYEFVETPSTILDIGGYFTSGGMMGNMAALLVARNNLDKNSQVNGIKSGVKLIVPAFSSHYSTWNAMGWLGFGESNVVHVKTNNFGYECDELEKTLEKISAKDKILAVVVSLGDPYSMTVDNIIKVRKICNKYKVWLHADGANGGVLIFSKKYRDLLHGVELCDSISLDPHKALGLNYPCSLFLCKDIDKFNSIISHWNIINRKDSLDLGAITPFLNSRGFDSLKLWILLKYFGDDGLGKIIDNKIDSVKEIYKKMNKIKKGVIFWNSPDTFSILFQLLPNNKKKENISENDLNFINEYQERFKLELEKSTGIQIHSFKLPANIIYPCKEGLSTEVLCIQSAHEIIDIKIVNDFINNIKQFS